MKSQKKTDDMLNKSEFEFRPVNKKKITAVFLAVMIISGLFAASFPVSAISADVRDSVSDIIGRLSNAVDAAASGSASGSASGDSSGGASGSASGSASGDASGSASGDASGDASGEPTSGLTFTVKNYTLTITDAQDITAIRIAKGEFNTSGDIKNAPGCITLDAKVISAHRDASGTVTYELSDGGIYSLWYKYADGTTGIITGLDATYMEQTVTADGVKVTVENLYGVKDFFIAKGNYNSYREIKNAPSFVSVSSAKFGTAHSYTYGSAIGEPGDYTICIRYTDSSRKDEIQYFSCNVTTPVIYTNGRQVVFGNLEGVKVIRIVQGKYNSVAEVKSAPGALGYSAATIEKLTDIDGLFKLRKNASADGTVYTVSVVYNNFYQEIHQITLTKKVPAYTVNGNSITFTNLAGFTLIRYAPGKYTTSSGLKKAKGNEAIRPIDMDTTEVTITGLSGKYSFMVQYFEDSQSFYVIDF